MARQNATMVVPTYHPRNAEFWRALPPAPDQRVDAHWLQWNLNTGFAFAHLDFAEGHRGSALCHLGNIAWRLGRILVCDPQSGRIQGDRQAARLWPREYRRGWEPKVCPGSHGCGERRHRG